MRHLFLFMQNFHINSGSKWSHPEWSKARALVGNSWDGEWVHRERGGGWLVGGAAHPFNCDRRQKLYRRALNSIACVVPSELRDGTRAKSALHIEKAEMYVDSCDSCQLFTRQLLICKLLYYIHHLWSTEYCFRSVN